MTETKCNKFKRLFNTPANRHFLLECRGRNEILRNDDVIILEMEGHIQEASLKEHLKTSDENELKLKIRKGSRDEFGDIRINIR